MKTQHENTLLCTHNLSLHNEKTHTVPKVVCRGERNAGVRYGSADHRRPHDVPEHKRHKFAEENGHPAGCQVTSMPLSRHNNPQDTHLRKIHGYGTNATSQYPTGGMDTTRRNSIAPLTLSVRFAFALSL